MRRFAMVLCGIILAGQFGSRASAAIVITGAYQTGVSWPVPGTELNLNIAPTVTGSVGPGFGALGTAAILSDGSNGPDGAAPGGPQVTFINSGATVTYTLPSASTIYSLNTFSQWDTGRLDQDYEVYFSTDGTTFSPSPLVTVSYTPVGAIPGMRNDAWVNVTDDTGAPLGTGIKAVRFSFPSQQNGFVGYTELAISVPEPASIGMLALFIGGAALTSPRRARRGI